MIVTAPELHADDLLDKEARGNLSAAEKSRLDRHVEACSVCRFERRVRDDFRLEFEATRQTAGKEASQGSTQPYRHGAANGTRPSSGRTSSRLRLVLLMAAATLLAGAAAAEWETIKRAVFSSHVLIRLKAEPRSSVADSDAGHATELIGFRWCSLLKDRGDSRCEFSIRPPWFSIPISLIDKRPARRPRRGYLSNGWASAACVSVVASSTVRTASSGSDFFWFSAP